MPLLLTAPRGSTIATLLSAAKRVLLILSVATGGCDQRLSEPTVVPPLTSTQSEHFASIQSGDTGAARVRLRQMIDGGDTDSRTLFLMGLAHHWDRHYTRAAEWFQRADDALPPYPPAAHFLGWALYHAGHPEASRTAFERHLQDAPAEGDSHFGLGVLAMERGDFDVAEVAFDRAIAMQQDEPARAKGVAKALARLSEIREQRDGDRHAAAALLARAVAADQDLYEAHYRLARLLRLLGRGAAADAADAAGRAAEARAVEGRVRP